MTWILAHFWLTFALACAAATITVCDVIVLAGRKYTGCTRWPLPCACQDDDEADRAWDRVAEIPDDDWQRLADDYDEWERLDPDQAADTFIAELHTDLPGPAEAAAMSNWPSHIEQRRAGEHHERLAPPTIFDQLRDDPALIEWDLARQVEALRQHEIAARCQVTEIRRIRGELADLRKELCAA